MNEKCTKCIFEGCSGSVIKVLGNITVKKQKTETKKIGSVVESHIEEAKQEVKAEKDRMKKVEYKPE
jgi:3-deoxy-D-arabino-heptulosonate 7-phosphate (DAHP) synthase